MAISVTPSLKNLRGFRNTRVHGEFSVGELDVTGFVVDSQEVQYINDLKWSIDSTGHIKLYWRDSGEIIAFLSGNGRWEFDKPERIHAPSPTDAIVFDTVGFADLDSFTLILTSKV